MSSSISSIKESLPVAFDGVIYNFNVRMSSAYFLLDQAKILSVFLGVVHQKAEDEAVSIPDYEVGFENLSRWSVILKQNEEGFELDLSKLEYTFSLTEKQSNKLLHTLFVQEMASRVASAVFQAGLFRGFVNKEGRLDIVEAKDIVVNFEHSPSAAPLVLTLKSIRLLRMGLFAKVAAGLPTNSAFNDLEKIHKVYGRDCTLANYINYFCKFASFFWTKAMLESVQAVKTKAFAKERLCEFISQIIVAEFSKVDCDKYSIHPALLKAFISYFLQILEDKEYNKSFEETAGLLLELPFDVFVILAKSIVAKAKKVKLEKPERRSLLELFPRIADSEALERLNIGLADPFLERDLYVKSAAGCCNRLERAIPLKKFDNKMLRGPSFSNETSFEAPFDLGFLETNPLPVYEPSLSPKENILYPCYVEKDIYNPFAMGVAHHIGRRSEMQDEHIYDLLQVKGSQVPVYGIIDGHGFYGGEVATLVRDRMSYYLILCLSEVLGDDNNWDAVDLYLLEQALTLSCILLDEDLARVSIEDGVCKLDYSGAAVCFSLIIGKRVVTCNTGDCRAIMIDAENTIKQLSEDASPDALSYEKSAIKRGGVIYKPGGDSTNQVSRLGGSSGLGLARALGDKKVVGRTARPKVTIAPIGKLLIITCDGPCESLNTEQIAVAARRLIDSGKNLKEAAEYLVRLAYYNHSGDNMSVMIVKTDED